MESTLTENAERELRHELEYRLREIDQQNAAIDNLIAVHGDDARKIVRQWFAERSPKCERR